VTAFVNYSIKGGKEVAALIAQLPVQIETKLLRNGLAAGANIIRDEAKALAPKKSGLMAEAIKTVRRSGTPDGEVVVKIRLKGPHAYLGLMIEYGVKTHLIWVRSKKDLAINGVVIGHRVWHPGFAEKPFMRPALDSKAGEAVQAVVEYVAANIKWGPITAPTIAVDMEEAA